MRRATWGGRRGAGDVGRATWGGRHEAGKAGVVPPGLVRVDFTGGIVTLIPAIETVRFLQVC
jgi:hypothetical protein